MLAPSQIKVWTVLDPRTTSASFVNGSNFTGREGVERLSLLTTGKSWL